MQLIILKYAMGIQIEGFAEHQFNFFFHLPALIHTRFNFSVNQ